jgi:uncharacterized protein (TIGR03085 family)
MSSWSRLERLALADLFEQVGPDAPTLCTGWATRDLAAHLALRDRRVDAASAIFVRQLEPHAKRVQRGFARKPWPELVALVREGPPMWSVGRLPPVDAAVNTVEFFVHHEDVRRAQDGWQPRTLGPEFQDTLWRRLRAAGRLVMRRAPAGVVLRRPDGGEIVAKAGTPSVTVSGLPSEILLFAYGRQDHARVELVGDAELVDRMRVARFGV